MFTLLPFHWNHNPLPTLNQSASVCLQPNQTPNSGYKPWSLVSKSCTLYALCPPWLPHSTTLQTMFTENIIQAGIKLFNISELDKTNKLLIKCDLCPFLPVKFLFCRQVIVVYIDSKCIDRHIKNVNNGTSCCHWLHCYYNNKTASLVFIAGWWALIHYI